MATGYLATYSYHLYNRLWKMGQARSRHRPVLMYLDTVRGLYWTMEMHLELFSEGPWAYTLFSYCLSIFWLHNACIQVMEFILRAKKAPKTSISQTTEHEIRPALRLHLFIFLFFCMHVCFKEFKHWHTNFSGYYCQKLYIE